MPRLTALEACCLPANYAQSLFLATTAWALDDRVTVCGCAPLQALVLADNDILVDAVVDFELLCSDVRLYALAQVPLRAALLHTLYCDGFTACDCVGEVFLDTLIAELMVAVETGHLIGRVLLIADRTFLFLFFKQRITVCIQASLTH